MAKCGGEYRDGRTLLLRAQLYYDLPQWYIRSLTITVQALKLVTLFFFFFDSFLEKLSDSNNYRSSDTLKELRDGASRGYSLRGDGEIGCRGRGICRTLLNIFPCLSAAKHPREYLSLAWKMTSPPPFERDMRACVKLSIINSYTMNHVFFSLVLIRLYHLNFELSLYYSFFESKKGVVFILKIPF